MPSQQIALVTDYKYDDLYRVIEVKTPAGKLIKYQYDGLGRQSQRETPDAGITRYWYDKNNNLTYSQDEVQRSGLTAKYTLRTYDGLNRLLTLSEETPNDPNEEEDNPTSGNVFTLNCYDSLAYAPLSGIFTNVPSDYYSVINNTKGAIVATAYRTLLTDGWSYKFYRYDARGRVTRFWHYINGLGWKSENYYYNSQNQVIRNWYQPNQSDGKVFTYSYDDAARLINTNLYLGSHPENPEEESDAPSSFLALSKYTYNENSQVGTHGLNSDQFTVNYNYNNRNWIQHTTASSNIFRYILLYNPNGNIRYSETQGTYSNNFSVTGNKKYLYQYDNSNRLLKANEIVMADSNSFDIINNYDKDGNFVNMKRYGSANNLVGNFNYQYFSGTNKLQTIGSGSDFSYDANGNVTFDDLNKNTEIKYDYRNLMIENKNVLSLSTYRTFYRYDEAGNRINKKQYMYVLNSPPGGIEGGNTVPENSDSIIVDEGDGNGYWAMVGNTFYVRDISGKEIAVYSGSSLTQWNIWGLEQVGHMNSDTTKYYYLKDHLGSVRCVLNSTNQVVSANDYDCWGYPLENRSYQPENSKYKFTGKERDKDLENNYDYFGARYYDSRIGRWGQIEPNFKKYIDVSPYNYCYDNPLIITDPNGKDPKRNQLGTLSDVLNTINDLTVKDAYSVQKAFDQQVGRYIYTESGGFIDMKHFFAAAFTSKLVGFGEALDLGEKNESDQEKENSASAWDPEDLPSNLEGAVFGQTLSNPFLLTAEDIAKFTQFINDEKPLDPNDPRIARDKLYIPENANDVPLPQRKIYTAYRGEAPDYKKSEK